MKSRPFLFITLFLIAPFAIFKLRHADLDIEPSGSRANLAAVFDADANRVSLPAAIDSHFLKKAARAPNAVVAAMPTQSTIEAFSAGPLPVVTASPLPNADAAASGVWTVPDRAFYLDSSPQQLKMISVLQKLDHAAEVPIGEVYDIGNNDQGFNEDGFPVENGEVTEWRNADGSLSIAEVKYADGSHMLRTPGTMDEDASIDHFAADGSFHRLTLYASGHVKSLYFGDKTHETIYQYDESGKITDVFSK